MTSGKFVPADQAVRERLKSELNTSLLIEAGAGTGKTTLLIERLLALIETGMSLKEIVAITFTEKAAAELQERLRTALEIIVAAIGTESGAFYLEALSDLDHCHVSTIHAFASSLLRQRALEINLDPDFELIEDEEEGNLRRSILISWLNRDEEDQQQMLTSYLQFGGSFSRLIESIVGKELYSERDVLAGMFDEASAERVEKWKQPDSLPDINSVIEPILDRLNILHQDAESSCSDHSDFQYTQISQCVRGYEDARSSEERLVAWLMSLTKISYTKGKAGAWINADACKDFKAGVRELRVEADSILSRCRSEIAKMLLNWISALFKDVDDAKRRDGRVSYQDMLLLARDMLNDPAHLRYFHRRFKAILIDEFQDTDPLQVDIALKLATSIEDIGEAVQKLQPGRLCLIGDPKQSIYRFRRADARIYAETRSILHEQGEAVKIVQNFRSDAGVVKFVNDFCAGIWKSDSIKGMEYDPIAPLPPRTGRQLTPAVRVVIPANIDEKLSADQARCLEASVMADMIQSAVLGDKPEIVVKNRDGSHALKPVEYGDIAVLFATTTELGTYATEFAQRGIPHQFTAGKGMFQTQIVLDLYNCLRAVDNPADRLAVLGALRSRFLCVSDPVIHAWVNGNRVLDYRTVKPPRDSVLSDALTMLKDLFSKKNSQKPSLLIESLFSRTGIMQTLATDYFGMFERRVLSRIHEVAYKIEQDSSNGLRDVCIWLKGAMEGQGLDNEDASGSASDSVRIMTVHSAKGLEFPVVILSSVNWSVERADKVLVDRLAGRVEVNFGNKNDSFQTTGYDNALESEMIEAANERARLIYVAMTRARDYLWLPLVPTGKSNPYSSYLHDYIEGSGSFAGCDSSLVEIMTLDQLQIRKSVDESEESSEKIIAEQFLSDREKWAQKRAQRVEQLNSGSVKIHSPSESVDDFSADELSVTDTARDEAMRVGSAVHEYMFRCPRDKAIDDQLVASLAEYYEVDKSSILYLIQRCLRSKVWEEALAARRVWREVPYVVSSEEVATTIVTNGMIDLMWEDQLGLIHIADWKTGSVIREEYASQIRSYINATQRLTSQNIGDCYVFLAGNSDLVTYPAEKQSS